MLWKNCLTFPGWTLLVGVPIVLAARRLLLHGAEIDAVAPVVFGSTPPGLADPVQKQRVLVQSGNADDDDGGGHHRR